MTTCLLRIHCHNILSKLDEFEGVLMCPHCYQAVTVVVTVTQPTLTYKRTGPSKHLKKKKQYHTFNSINIMTNQTSQNTAIGEMHTVN